MNEKQIVIAYEDLVTEVRAVLRAAREEPQVDLDELARAFIDVLVGRVTPDTRVTEVETRVEGTLTVTDLAPVLDAVLE